MAWSLLQIWALTVTVPTSTRPSGCHCSERMQVEHGCCSPALKSAWAATVYPKQDKACCGARAGTGSLAFSELVALSMLLPELGL